LTSRARARARTYLSRSATLRPDSSKLGVF